MTNPPEPADRHDPEAEPMPGYGYSDFFLAQRSIERILVGCAVGIGLVLIILLLVLTQVGKAAAV